MIVQRIKAYLVYIITAITGDPQRNIDFYVNNLGLRFVRRLTVNQDDLPHTIFIMAMWWDIRVLFLLSFIGQIYRRVREEEVKSSATYFSHP